MSSESEARSTMQNGETSENSRGPVSVEQSVPGASSLAAWDPMAEDFSSAVFNSYKEPSTEELASSFSRNVEANSSPPPATVPQTNNRSGDTRLYVGKIPMAIEQAGLKNLFSQVGEVIYCKVLPPRDPCSKTKIGFVGYNTVKEALSGIQKFDGFDLGEGMRLKVSLALAKSLDERTMAYQKSGQELTHLNGPTNADAKCNVSGSLKMNGEENIEKASNRTTDQSHSEQAMTPKNNAKTGPNQCISTKACTLCKKPGLKWCSQCKTPYCSEKCQRQDWSQHKKICTKKSPVKKPAGKPEPYQTEKPEQQTKTSEQQQTQTSEQQQQTKISEQHQPQTSEQQQQTKTPEQQQTQTQTQTSGQQHPSGQQQQTKTSEQQQTQTQTQTSEQQQQTKTSEQQQQTKTSEQQQPQTSEQQQMETAGKFTSPVISEDDVEIDSLEVAVQLLGLNISPGEKDEEPLLHTDSQQFSSSVDDTCRQDNQLSSMNQSVEGPGPTVELPSSTDVQKVCSASEGEEFAASCDSGHKRFYANELAYVAMPQRNTFDVVVTEVCSPSLLWSQLCEPEYLEQQEKLRKDLQARYSGSVFENYVPSIGELCVAQFTLDNCWYRAAVDHVASNGMLHVTYIDFGNNEDIGVDRVRHMKEAFAHVPRQAVKLALRGVLGGVSDECLDFLKSRVLGVTCKAKLQDESSGDLLVDLFDLQGETLSSILVNRGYTQSIVPQPEQAELKPNPEVSQVPLQQCETNTSTASGSREPPVNHSTTAPNKNPSSVIGKSLCNQPYLSGSPYSAGAPIGESSPVTYAPLYTQPTSSTGSPHSTVPTEESSPVNDAPFYTQPTSSTGSPRSTVPTEESFPVNDAPFCTQPTSSTGSPHSTVPTEESFPVNGAPLYTQPTSSTGSPHSTVPTEESSPVNDAPLYTQPTSSTGSPHSTVPTEESFPVNGAPLYTQPTSSTGSPHSTVPTEESFPVNGAPLYTQPTSSTGSPHSTVPTEESSPVNDAPLYTQPTSSTGSPHSTEVPITKSPPVNCASFSSRPSVPSESPHNTEVQRRNDWGDLRSLPPVKQKNSSVRRSEGAFNKVSFEGIVNVVVSPWEFFVQETEQKRVESLVLLVKSLQQYIHSCPADNNTSRRPRDTCAAQFTLDNQWYRAEILQLLPGGFKVRYTDFGNSEVVPPSRVRDLPARFQDLPHLSVICSLAGVRKPKGCQEWSREATSYFASLVAHTTLLCRPVVKRRGVLVVELLDRDGRPIVTENMIKSGFADRFVVGGSDTKQPIEELVFQPAIEGADLPRNKEMIDVILTEIVSPGLMYVQVVKHAPHLAQVTEDMNSHYGSTNYSQCDVKEGQFYAALFTETNDWCRAFVKTAASNGSFCVQYVDFGNTEVLPWSQLRPLEKRFFHLPFCALRCSLAHVAPNRTKEWSEEATELIKSKLPLFSRVNARLVARRKGMLFVDILEPSGTDSLSHVLIRNRLAK